MEFKFKEDELLDIKSTKPTYLKDNLKGVVFHNTYLDYLYHGYAKHYGIEVKPDYIWFTILNEISRIVTANPNEYKEIFTTSDKQKEISVFTGDPIVMPIESLLEGVFKEIPSNLKKDNIVLNFSTTTHSAKIAFSTAFLEASSPYYCYSMFMCGFNKINVLGTIQDYELMKQSIESLIKIFSGKSILNYFNKIKLLINKVISNFNNQDFWRDIFYVKECGSGHQEEVKGWFKEFFDPFKGLQFMEAFPKHISSIEYKNLSTGLSYKMKVGLFSSIIKDGYLITDFEFGINKI